MQGLRLKDYRVPKGISAKTTSEKNRAVQKVARGYQQRQHLKKNQPLLFREGTRRKPVFNFNSDLFKNSKQEINLKKNQAICNFISNK